MIKIIRSDALPKNFFSERKFSGVKKTVEKILKKVETQGDIALKKLSKKFDGVNFDSFEIPKSEANLAAKNLECENPKLFDALCRSRDLAFSFAKKQRKCFFDFNTELDSGVIAGQKNLAVSRAGLYVPAGQFPLLSSVVMTWAPAKAAGVEEIVLCTPPKVNPQNFRAPYCDKGILATAGICGIDRIFSIGGAQAIFAMALGTKSIPRCDVIAGPGNKFVAEAKKLIFGRAGIDMVAGPSEVFVIADFDSDEKLIAADLLAQAEHDVAAQAILATPDENLAKKTAQKIEEFLNELPTAKTARQSIEKNSAIIITHSIFEAAELANKKAPEHLEIVTENSETEFALEKSVKNYGSLFLGSQSAEVFGDYAAGVNHTLPTGGVARFSGGLSVRAFLKTVTTLRLDSEKIGAKKSQNASEILATAEGLFAHALAAKLRSK